LAAGDPDAATLLEKVEQRVFAPTSTNVETSNIKVGSIALLKEDNVPPFGASQPLVEV